MPQKTPQQTILIVDDEQDLREILAFNLNQSGFNCLTAADGIEALKILARQALDLVLLDVLMPQLSGFEVAQRLRNDEVVGVDHDLPIIFLTALGEEDDVLRGFGIGADDYICKPFSVREVSARVEAVLKRSKSNNNVGGTTVPIQQLTYEDLLLDDRTFTATLCGNDIGLTKMEYELLHFLIEHPQSVYSRTDLLYKVWPQNGLVLDRTVDVTITRLRKKIGPYKENLRTKNGYGYYWKA